MRPYSQRGRQAAGAVASTGMSKTTCGECKSHVLIVEIEGERITTDPELVTVISDDPRAQARRGRVTGRRLHAESCARLQREAERAKLREEQRVWQLQQQKALAPVASQRAQRKFKRTEGM